MAIRDGQVIAPLVAAAGVNVVVWTASRQPGSYVDGYAAGFQAGGGQVPAVSNLTPVAAAIAGSPGAFSSSYSIARYTPITFDLNGLPSGFQPVFSIKFANRSETYVIRGRDALGVYNFLWPFDASSSIGSLAANPIHVSILPRDGWPPTPWTLQIGMEKAATVP